jgi:D-alanyl-D-alanine carboxypeptidase
LHLLTHQSGLKDYNGDQRFYLDVINNPNKRWTQQDLLRYVNDKPALFWPGARASYCNTNTVLVTMIIESATGKSHATLLREKIFTPLGMHSTYYQGHDALPPRRIAQGYFDLFQDDVLVNVSDYNFGYGNGAGGLVSNVQDMQVFIRALFVKKALLTQASLDRMQQGYRDRERPQEYGIGLIKQFIGFGPDVVVYGHGGGDIGYTAHVQWIPERNVSMAMFTNTGTGWGGSLGVVYYDFRSELLEAILN